MMSPEREKEALDLDANLDQLVDIAEDYVYESRILQTLHYSALDQRWDRVQESYEGTSNWIYNDATYFEAWLREYGGVYWIHGKPGSGKSTLMKHIFSNESTLKALEEWSGSSKLIFARHFFWISGSNSLQRSQIGLYRSLLFQIFRSEPGLILQSCKPFGADCGAWSMSNFKSVLRNLATLIGTTSTLNAKLAIFIDGMDEYDVSVDGHPHDIVDVVLDLSKWDNIKLCVSSRSWSVFRNEFGDSKFQVAIHSHTFPDMKKFASEQLHRLRAFRKFQQTDRRWCLLPQDIAEKAEGVWLWTSLVAKDVLRKVADGEGYESVKSLLDNIPRDLNEYFRELVERSNDEYREEGARILLIALLSDYELNAVGLGLLLQHPQDLSERFIQQSFCLRREFWSLSTIRDRLNNRCRDLLEIGAEPTVSSPLPRDTIFGRESDSESDSSAISAPPDPLFEPRESSLRENQNSSSSNDAFWISELDILVSAAAASDTEPIVSPDQNPILEHHSEPILRSAPVSSGRVPLASPIRSTWSDSIATLHVPQVHTPTRRSLTPSINTNASSRISTELPDGQIEYESFEELKSNKVEFIHRTVRDFLKEFYLEELRSHAGTGFDVEISVLSILMGTLRLAPVESSGRMRESFVELVQKCHDMETRIRHMRSSESITGRYGLRDTRIKLTIFTENNHEKENVVAQLKEYFKIMKCLEVDDSWSKRFLSVLLIFGLAKQVQHSAVFGFAASVENMLRSSELHDVLSTDPVFSVALLSGLKLYARRLAPARQRPKGEHDPLSDVYNALLLLLSCPLKISASQPIAQPSGAGSERKVSGSFKVDLELFLLLLKLGADPNKLVPPFDLTPWQSHLLCHYENVNAPEGVHTTSRAGRAKASLAGATGPLAFPSVRKAIFDEEHDLEVAALFIWAGAQYPPVFHHSFQALQAPPSKGLRPLSLRPPTDVISSIYEKADFPTLVVERIAKSSYCQGLRSSEESALYLQNLKLQLGLLPGQARSIPDSPMVRTTIQRTLDAKRRLWLSKLQFGRRAGRDNHTANNTGVSPDSRSSRADVMGPGYKWPEVVFRTTKYGMGLSINAAVMRKG
ncbi:hypothetical protein BJ508DRAFT_21 [Ascobolus immersus RN42]|uniref:Nephrocystin 3-like N-terminal domain-containing protein n=1 Tax=Ascobolus immersus RN42 TaxID=1160509 RepID=A0A3N4IUJ5_ASCIM|nr:hypothetical protein BJ508DRAFT_21 [Ascobolus immersus RN42]